MINPEIIHQEIQAIDARLNGFEVLPMHTITCLEASGEALRWALGLDPKAPTEKVEA